MTPNEKIRELNDRLQRVLYERELYRHTLIDALDIMRTIIDNKALNKVDHIPQEQLDSIRLEVMDQIAKIRNMV